jgi:N-methylhydantoinase A/oxoprolinase/acetone carboxylase beta subunit
VTRRSLLLGVDTGGTYTDAVVLDTSGRDILATAKAVTTRGDLAVGLVEAMTGAIGGLPPGAAAGDVRLLSVSTTLATNAVVEGHGGRVATVLIGFDDAMAARTGIASAFPGMPMIRVAGGHDHAGEERAPLDTGSLRASVAAVGAAVDSFAVASAFAVRNPAHEHAARDIISALTGLPVTVSTELTSDLDAPRRALTAVLNARLVPKISALIDAVTVASRRLGLTCPVTVVKGDGSLALAERVARRPIETILSGPAASVVGTSWLCGLPSFVVSDIGGTTTDLAVVHDGRAVTAEDGAVVGGWRTMVRAMAVTTLGLGGDSEVEVLPDGRVALRPNRVVPLSLLAVRHPGVCDHLRADLADEFMSALHGRFVLRPFGAAGAGDGAGNGTGNGPADLSHGERELLAAVGADPVPARWILRASGSQRALGSLVRRGVLQVSALTPSDAAHVLGRQDTWSAEAARLGARLAVRMRQMRAPTDDLAEALCEDVLDAAVTASAAAVLDVVLGPGTGGPLVAAVAAGRPRVGLATVALRPDVPVVAVGGPARLVYPEVGRRLGVDVVLPVHAEVANAVGAATAVVVRTVVVDVEADPAGGFRVHGPEGIERRADGSAALAAAERTATAAARAAALEAGGADPRVSVHVNRLLLPGATDDRGLMSATVTAEAVAVPAARAVRGQP